MKKKILISNGYKDFFLISTAKKLLKLNFNISLFSGYFLNSFLEALSKKTKIKHYKITKLIQRRQQINHKYLKTFFFGELIHEISLYLKNYEKISNFLRIISYKLYQFKILRYLKNNHQNINVYHFRSGFGGRSIKFAKSCGIKVICDHSIAHPSLIEFMTENKGKFPKKKPELKNNFWKYILNDLEKTDIVLVNSNFVKKTLIYMGVPQKKIKIIYLGLDARYPKLNKDKKYPNKLNNKIKFIFAGGIEKRKGIYEIIKAFKQLENLKIQNFELNLVGSISDQVKNKFDEFINNKNIKYHGILNYKDLINLMFNCHVLVFPSRVEGSARVVPEAMAAGCAIITTENTGSVVKNKKNGIIISPGDSVNLLKALIRFIKNPKLIKLYGSANKNLIFRKYNTNIYIKNLIKLYNSNNV